MKTWKAVAVMLLGMALAAPAWGHPDDADSNIVMVTCTGRTVTLDWHIHHESRRAVSVHQVLPAPLPIYMTYIIPNYETHWPHSGSYTFQGQWGGLYRASESDDSWLPWHKDSLEHRSPIPITSHMIEGPDAVCDDAPVAPPEVGSCGHIAIVPAMPRALPGDDEAADHWLRISNPGGASITFTVTGRNDAGDPEGSYSYRRELPAYKSVNVNMRDIEAAFGVEPEGWWTLTVTGSGPLYASATMKQGEARRLVPVERPATCEPLARAGD